MFEVFTPQITFIAINFHTFPVMFTGAAELPSILVNTHFRMKLILDTSRKSTDDRTINVFYHHA